MKCVRDKISLHMIYSEYYHMSSNCYGWSVNYKSIKVMLKIIFYYVWSDCGPSINVDYLPRLPMYSWCVLSHRSYILDRVFPLRRGQKLGSRLWSTPGGNRNEASNQVLEWPTEQSWGMWCEGSIEDESLIYSLSCHLPRRIDHAPFTLEFPYLG